MSFIMNPQCSLRRLQIVYLRILTYKRVKCKKMKSANCISLKQKEKLIQSRDNERITHTNKFIFLK